MKHVQIRDRGRKEEEEEEEEEEEKEEDEQFPKLMKHIYHHARRRASLR